MNRRSFFRTLGAAVVGAMIGVGLKPIEPESEFDLDKFKNALLQVMNQRTRPTFDILTDRETANAIQKALQAHYATKYSVRV